MRIAVRANDVRAARAAQDALARADIDALALVSARGQAPEGADALIFVGEGARDEAARMRAEGVPALALLEGAAGASPPAPGLACDGPFDGAVALDAPAALLQRQVEIAVRVGAAREECARRRETAAAFGVTAPAHGEARRLRALYIGAPSPAFLALEHDVEHYGGETIAAFTSFTGFDHLHDDAFDAVLINGAPDAPNALALCAALRRNSGLASMPTMLIAARADTQLEAAAVERGAAAVWRAQDGAAALGWLFEAVRMERRRRAAEHDMRALCDVLGDARTGLYRAEAFAAHVQRLAEDHHRTGRALAVAALRVMPAHGARAPAPALWRKRFIHVAGLAAQLLRDGDSGAVDEEVDTICLALPFTAPREARALSERIASVAECTAFAAGEGETPLVIEQSVAELQPGESGAGLMARARAVLDWEPMRA